MVIDISQNLPQIIRLCRENGVARLWLFGSATGRTRRDFSPASDIDFLVEFDAATELPHGWNHPLFKLPDLFQSVLGRPVHLTEAADFHNPYFARSVEETKELLMTSEAKKLLWDIRQAGLLVLEFVKDLTVDSFASNRLVQAAVEREFEIMGEAARRL